MTYRMIQDDATLQLTKYSRMEEGGLDAMVDFMHRFTGPDAGKQPCLISLSSLPNIELAECDDVILFKDSYFDNKSATLAKKTTHLRRRMTISKPQHHQFQNACRVEWFLTVMTADLVTEYQGVEKIKAALKIKNDLPLAVLFPELLTEYLCVQLEKDGVFINVAELAIERYIILISSLNPESSLDRRNAHECLKGQVLFKESIKHTGVVRSSDGAVVGEEEQSVSATGPAVAVIPLISDIPSSIVSLFERIIAYPFPDDPNNVKPLKPKALERVLMQ